MCKTCSAKPDNCVTCHHELRAFFRTCECLDGYFDKDGNCEKCSHLCKVCKGSADNCGTCKKGLARIPIAPTCGCEDGYFAIDREVNCK